MLDDDKAGFPGTMDQYRVQDSLFAEAYEGTPPQIRALLKTAIAFYFRLYGKKCDSEIQEIRSHYSGFQFTKNKTSVPWVLAVIEGSFASPALFLAQLCPAILAGVSRICIASQNQFPPLLLTAMELAGLEECFVLPKQELIQLYEKFSHNGEGRLILFSSGKEKEYLSIATELINKALYDNIPFLFTKESVQIACQYSDDKKDDKKKILKILYPNSQSYTKKTLDKKSFDALFTDEYIANAALYKRILGPGMEACFPLTSPEFFRNNIYNAQLYLEKNDE